MKFLQIVTLLCGLAGSVLGIGLMFQQAERTPGADNSNTIEVHKPSFDANGEPN